MTGGRERPDGQPRANGEGEPIDVAGLEDAKEKPDREYSVAGDSADQLSLGVGIPGSWDTRKELANWSTEGETARDRFCRHYLGVVQGMVATHRLWPPLRNRAEVEDVAQEVWSRLLAKVQSQGGWHNFEYRGKGSLEAYLFKVVDHTIKDYNRREHADKRGGGATIKPLSVGDEADGDPSLQQAREETPTEFARSNETHETAQRVLTTEEHEVWSWIDLEGYTSVEVSAWIRKSPEAVRSILYRARKKLRDHIGGQ